MSLVVNKHGKVYSLGILSTTSWCSVPTLLVFLFISASSNIVKPAKQPHRPCLCRKDGAIVDRLPLDLRVCLSCRPASGTRLPKLPRNDNRYPLITAVEKR